MYCTQSCRVAMHYPQTVLLKYMVTMGQIHASKQAWQQLCAAIRVQIHAGGLHNGPTHRARALLPLMPF
jgi:hypothetical protein